jgi:radial spoke head protein 4A
MKEIFNRVMLFHKHDSFDKLEEISHLIKKTHLKIRDPLKDSEVNRPKPTKKSEIVDRYIQEFRRLIKESVLVEAEDEQFVEKEIKCAIDDLPCTMKMFEWAGISFGDAEAFRLYKAMKRLAKTSGATCLRFWGKYLGRKCDYFVIEGQLPYSEEAKSENGAEDRGKGINSHVYWVTDDLLSDWVQLPESEPRYIHAARNIKYLVTGNLNADLNTNPKFPGKERHFLRAQIARISHTTTIVPKDYLGPNEDNERLIKFSEEFASPAASDLNNVENWVHHYQNILLAGRAEHEIPNLPEEEVEEAVAALEEKDPFIERLKGINEDKQVHKTIDGAWVTKLVGNNQQYAADEGTSSYVC